MSLLYNHIHYSLAAISTALGLFPDFLRQIQDTAEQARQPFEAAALARREKAAAEGDSRASGALVRAHNRRSVRIGTLAVAAAVAGALGDDCWWGHSAAVTQIRLADTSFADVAHDSPAGWFNLARLNEPCP